MPLDAIVTVFIFLVGLLPALLLQALDPELRIIVRKQRTQLVAFVLLPILVSWAVIVWGVWLSKLEIRSSNTGFLITCTLSLLQRHESQLLWMLILTFLVIISGVSALILDNRWRRENIIKHLEQETAKHLSKWGRPIEEKLKGLLQLGRNSQPGQNKELVLQALADLASKVQRGRHYDGRQLQALIKGLEDVLLGHEIGSSNNFGIAADLLAEVVIPAARTRHSEDLKLTVQAISALARKTMLFETLYLPLKFLEALELLYLGDHAAVTLMSQALFEIGSEAIERQQPLVAMAALSKLDGLAQRQPRIEGELAHDYLSLIAHFWNNGETAQRYAAKILNSVQAGFTIELPEAIHAAQAHCAQTAKFKTADYLITMRTSMQETQLLA